MRRTVGLVEVIGQLPQPDAAGFHSHGELLPIGTPGEARDRPAVIFQDQTRFIRGGGVWQAA